MAEEREFLYEFFMNGYIVYKNSVLPIFYQMFTRPKVLVCIIRQFVNYALKNFCIVWINVLSHIYQKGHVTNEQLNIMHFCWRSLDDKSLSSLLELRKSVFPMHVCKYCKHYMAESVWLWLWHDLFWYKTLIFYSRWRKYFSAFKT